MRIVRLFGGMFCVVFIATVFSYPVYAQDANATTTTSTVASTSTQASTSTAPTDTPDNSASGDQSVYSNNSAPNQTPRQDGAYESARLISTHLAAEGTELMQSQKQFYDIEIRSGSLKGKRLTISSDVEANPYQIDPQPGDKLVVFIQMNDQGEPIIYLEGFDRRWPLVTLIIIFILALVVLAGWQGFKVACSILLSILVIGWVLIPAFLKGINPVPVAMILTVVLTYALTGMSIGWNRKAAFTAIGTLGGVISAYLLTLAFSGWAHLSGLGTEEDRLFFAQNPTLDPHNLFFAGIIIAAMGVIEDVAVSIASGVEEIRRHKPQASFKELFRSGMIIGKDHMSAMANTLIFAYVGASLSTLLLYTQYNASWLKFLNFDTVSEEVIRSLTATIGLVFTVPITALLAAGVLAKFGKRKKVLVHRHEG